MDRPRGRGALVVALLCALALLAGSFGAVRLLPPWPPSPRSASGSASTPDLGPATIFLDSQAPHFSVPIASVQGANRVQAAYSVTNVNGLEMAAGAAPIARGIAAITLPRLPDGYYTLRVAPPGDAASQTAIAIPFGVLAPFTPSADVRFGVVTHFATGNPTPLLNTARALGITGVRDDLLWRDIETRPGQYDFPPAYDAYMAEVAREHVRPAIVLGYSNPLYDGGATPYDDAGMSAFVNYVRAVLAHYGHEIQAVEVFNEYDIPQFTSGPCGQKPSCYVELLRRTYAAIKATRPDVTVVGATAAGYDVPWYQQVFAGGGLRFLDAVAIHPYVNGAPEASQLATTIGTLRQLIQRYNGGRTKPIWLTEMGWASYDGLDELTQAKYAARGLTLLTAAGVTRFYWYDLLNDTSSNPMVNAFGLLRRPDVAGAAFAPKPAFVAYAVAVRQLSGAVFQAAEPVTGGAGSIYDERFVRGGTELRVLWTTGATRSVTLAASSPLRVTVMLGTTRTVTPVNGRVTLTFSDRPVYVEGAARGVTASGTPAALVAPTHGGRVMGVQPARAMATPAVAAAVCLGLPDPFRRRRARN